VFFIVGVGLRTVFETYTMTVEQKTDRMNMPRLTAEASFYNVSEHYQMAQIIFALKSDRPVVP
jgi:hypothetical protein